MEKNIFNNKEARPNQKTKFNIINKFKELNFGTAIVSFLILGSTFYVVDNLKDIRSSIESTKTTKLYIVDEDELGKLCNGLVEQWGFEHYGLYIYQPNSPIKTHKELVVTDIPQSVPLRLELDEFIKTKTFTYGETKDLTDLDMVVEQSKYYVRLPIYQYKVIVAEMFIFTDENPTNSSFNIQNYLSESQIISNLIM